MKKNKRKEDYVELSQKLDKVINKVIEIKPNWPKMDNIVDTYNTKINDIESNLNEQMINLWSNDFELGKAIDYDLQEKMAIGLSNSMIIAKKTITISNENITKTTKKRKIREIRKSSAILTIVNDYIKNYNINENIYETAVVYLKSIQSLSDDGKVKLSCKKINRDLEQLGYDIQINEDQITKIINPKVRQTTKIKPNQRKRTYQLR